MDHVLGHQLILVTSAATICAMSYMTGWPERPSFPDEQATTVLVVSQRADITSRDHSGPLHSAVPRDTETLIREIQRQLKRLSCYNGPVDGKWSPQVRAATKVFADRVNARLPVDRPDYILLRLTETHAGTACAAAGSKAALPSPSLLREGRVPTGDAKLH